MNNILETCPQYVARRLSEGWRIVKQEGFVVVLQSPEGIIRPVDLRNDIETLRPNAAGDYTNIDHQHPSEGEHWDKVDEEITDEDDTYISTGSTSLQKDAYNLQDTAIPDGCTINSVRVYFRIKSDYTGNAQPFLRLGTSETAGTLKQHSAGWTTFSQILARPGGGSWSLSDLNSLQVVIGLRTGGGPYGFYCTQVYVEVNYTPHPPTVTTQAVSDIGTSTATGHGTITDIGVEICSKRGVCWNTTGNPTVADSKSEETDSFGTGAFESPMTGLTPDTHYYVKAYAYNSAGYGYGSQVEFTTKAYYATGYIGDVIDCTDLVKTYDRLEWTEEIPGAGPDIEIKIRSSPDLSTWTIWEVIYSSPCTSFETPVQRYLEWVATLTIDQHNTPKLKDLVFSWTKKVE